MRDLSQRGFSVIIRSECDTRNNGQGGRPPVDEAIRDHYIGLPVERRQCLEQEIRGFLMAEGARISCGLAGLDGIGVQPPWAFQQA